MIHDTCSFPPIHCRHLNWNCIYMPRWISIDIVHVLGNIHINIPFRNKFHLLKYMRALTASLHVGISFTKHV